ncbi:MAG: hypothetical protein AAF719_04725 [Pseudomonadota bacterium]
MSRSFKSSLLALVAGAFMTSQTALAHEVNASTVKIAIDGARLEILQTTPLGAARSIAHSLSGDKTDAADEEGLLKAISKGWSVAAGAENCDLSRQAFRRVHHDQELQMRYLFECQSGSAPTTLSASWLEHASKDHFLIFTLSHRKNSKTVIFQRQALSIDISAFAEDQAS